MDTRKGREQKANARCVDTGLLPDTPELGVCIPCIPGAAPEFCMLGRARTAKDRAYLQKLHRPGPRVRVSRVSSGGGFQMRVGAVGVEAAEDAVTDQGQYTLLCVGAPLITWVNRCIVGAGGGCGQAELGE